MRVKSAKEHFLFWRLVCLSSLSRLTEYNGHEGEHSRSENALVSVASLWEMAIKSRKGRLTGVEEYLNRYDEFHDAWGFHLLAIEPQDAVAAGLLNVQHSDPFDRMLIVRARRAKHPIVTCDEAIVKFALATIW